MSSWNEGKKCQSLKQVNKIFSLKNNERLEQLDCSSRNRFKIKAQESSLIGALSYKCFDEKDEILILHNKAYNNELIILH